MSQNTKTSQPAPNVLIQQMPLSQVQQQPAPQQLSSSSSNSKQQQASSSLLYASPQQQQQHPFSPGQQAFSPASSHQQMMSQYQQQQAPSPYYQQPLSVPAPSPVSQPQKGLGVPVKQQSPVSQPQTARNPSAGSVFLEAMSRIEEMSPLALSRLGKELTQEAINRLCDLFQCSKALELPSPTSSQTVQAQKVQKLNQFYELLNYLQTVMKKIGEIKEILEEKERSLGLDATKLNEDQLLGLLMGKAVGGQAEEIRNSQEFKDLLQERDELEKELTTKRDQLIDTADFLRSLEWQLGAVVEKE